MPSSSCNSRKSARSAGSPASTFPPGNSHQPAYTLPAGRLASRKAPSARWITAAATSTIILFFGFRSVPARPVARELVGDAPAARTAQQRPLQHLLAGRADFAFAAAEVAHPVRGDGQVLVL